MSDLLEIARLVFKEKGAKLSVSDIAARAGLSRPTVYQRLGTKAEILARLSETPDGGQTPQDLEGRLMRAVLIAAANRGFRAMTLEEVADAAGIGVATIYRRYASKDGLIAAFVAQRAPDRVLADLPFDTLRGLDGLAQVIATLVDFMSDNRELVRLVLSGTQEDRQYLRSLRASTQSTSRKLEQYFAAQINDGGIADVIPPAALARHLFGMAYAQTVLADDAGTADRAAICAAIVEMYRPFFAKGRT